MSDITDLVWTVAGLLVQDPRVHPRRGDVVDDDPPLVPLTVVAVWPNEAAPRLVVGERRAILFGHPVVVGRWHGTLAEWIAEMRD